MDRCPNKYRQLHVGFKLKFPLRAYNVSVNYKRQILFSTDGHPASWNDKTLQTFNKVTEQLRSGHLLVDVKSTLYDRNTDGELIKVQYTGAWQLVDNRYLPWATATSNEIPCHRTRQTL